MSISPVPVGHLHELGEELNPDTLREGRVEGRSSEGGAPRPAPEGDEGLAGGGISCAEKNSEEVKVHLTVAEGLITNVTAVGRTR